MWGCVIPSKNSETVPSCRSRCHPLQSTKIVDMYNCTLYSVLHAATYIKWLPSCRQTDKSGHTTADQEVARGHYQKFSRFLWKGISDPNLKVAYLNFRHISRLSICKFAKLLVMKSMLALQKWCRKMSTSQVTIVFILQEFGQRLPYFIVCPLIFWHIAQKLR